MSDIKIPLVKDTVNDADISSLIEWLKTSPRLTKGPVTIQFEKLWSKFFNVKYSIFVNSGSSANLLMLYSLIISGKLKNKKILVPAISWATDLAPVLQFGLEPILVDCNLDDLSVDINHLKELIKTEEPSALILVSVLGFCPNMKEVVQICKEGGVILLEDNCESLGTEFEGKKLGGFGLMSSFSLYFGHHLSTIEGGVITTDDKEMYDVLKMLRSHGWDRDLDEEKQKELREKCKVDEFNALYKFYIPGFNVRSTDLQAFLGIEQLKKADYVFKIRERNFQIYHKNLKNDFCKQKVREEDFISNFCYPIIHPKKNEIVKALKEGGVEVRPLISGSMGYQPMYTKIYGEKKLLNADIIHEYGMYVPNNQEMSEEDVLYVCDIINKIISE